MRTTSQTWKDIVANGEFNMESVARIYGATGDDVNGVAGSDSRGAYKEYATITAPVISRSLLSGDALSVGNAIAGQLKFTLMTTDTIPKSAMIVIRGRVKDETNTSEWLEFGTYWLDHRVVTDNLIDIEAYDAMKKGNQAYVDNSQALVWPKTIKVVVQRIAEQMGVAIDSRTVEDIINNTDIGDLAIILKPDSGNILLDLLQWIGEIIGGNWIVTFENKLRFVPVVSPVDVSGYLLDHEYDTLTTEYGNRLLWRGRTDGESEESIEQLDVAIIIGSLTTATDYKVSKVTMSRDADHVYSHGDDTGFEVIVQDNPYATDDLCLLLYNELVGIEYVPYDITAAIYDPAAELGDLVSIDGVIGSVVYKETRELNVGFTADISAPGRDEIEDEFPFRTMQEKIRHELTSVEEKVGSALIQTQDSITAYVDGVANSFNETIIQDVLHYLVNNQSVGITTGDDNWTLSLPANNAGKYLWTYHTYTMSDGSVYSSEPRSYHVGEYNVTDVTPLYYAFPYEYTPPIPTELPITEDGDVQGQWTIGFPTLSLEYRYLYTTEQYTLENDTYDVQSVRRINAIDAVNKRLNTASLQITQYGVQISAIETNGVTKDSVRSDFALDPTNIVLTAGQDGHGHTTGTITMNAGTLIINGSNFSVDAEGIMRCKGASIEGAFEAVYDTSEEIPSEAGDFPVKLSINADGFVLSANNSQRLRIYEDAYVALDEQGIRIVDIGPVIETTYALQIKSPSLALPVQTRFGGAEGIHIDANGIYSGSKSAYNSYSAGFFLGSNGSFNIGDNTSYIRFNSTNLEINVDNVVIDGAIKNTGTIDSVYYNVEIKNGRVEGGLGISSGYISFIGIPEYSIQGTVIHDNNDVLLFGRRIGVVENISGSAISVNYGVTGQIPYIKSIRNNGDGTISWEYGWIGVINGIITSADLL